MEKRIYKCEDIMEILQCSKSTAYNVISILNKEWKAEGKLAISGRVSRDFFERRYLNAD